MMVVMVECILSTNGGYLLTDGCGAKIVECIKYRWGYRHTGVRDGYVGGVYYSTEQSTGGFVDKVMAW